MLLLVTILLVVVAAVMLVIGFVSSSLAPIYVSIACSALAAIVLLVFSRLSKREVAPATAGGPSPLPGPTPATASSAAGGGTSTAATTATAVLDRPAPTGPAPVDEGITVLPGGADSADGDAGSEGAADEATAQYAPLGEAEFPIEDYDELKVSDILPLLPELDADELVEVRQREQQGKARATILNRIDTLAAGASAAASQPAPESLTEPADAIASTDLESAVEDQQQEEEPEAVEIEAEPVAVPGTQPVSEPEPDLEPAGAGAADAEFPIADYDDLKVSEILPLLSQLEPDEIPVVRQREQSTKARGTILNRLDQVERSSGRSAAAEPTPAPAPAPAPARPAKRTAAKKSTGKKAAAAKTSSRKAAAPSKTGAKKAAAPAKKATRSTKK